jgi:hypothetical protein
MSLTDLKIRLEESYQELYGLRTHYRRTQQNGNKAKVRDAMMHLSACLDALEEIEHAYPFKEGESYYTIEKNSAGEKIVVKSVWMDEDFDLNKLYFKNLDDAYNGLD